MQMFRNLSKEEEAAFRLWARRHYRAFHTINGTWHPVMQDECRKINEEYGSGTEDQEPGVLKALENLITALEAGITTEILMACAHKTNSYVGQAREALVRAKGLIYPR